MWLCAMKIDHITIAKLVDDPIYNLLNQLLGSDYCFFPLDQKNLFGSGQRRVGLLSTASQK